MIFETAWSIPEPIFKKLSEEFPNDFIEIEFADEDVYGDNNGKIIYQDGLATISSNLGEEFAMEIWNKKLDNEKDIVDEMFD